MFFRRVFAKNATSSSSSGNSVTSSGGNSGMHAVHNLAMSSGGVPSESPARYRRALNVEDNHRVLSVLQLTPLWEYIIRNNELPVGLNMNELFREFLERLHDPEFQVRQHALRVLIDVIIVLRDETDIYFAPLLPPIIDNLGHPSPAVRKGALDVLKVYIAQTKLPETVMLEIMNYGMDRNPKDPLSSRYIVGVMLALPSLIQPAILTAKRTFILRAVINALGGKMVQITYQEIALKILLKIKNTIGSREFYECISVAYRRDFDLLCNVYGLPNPPKSPRRDPIVPPGEIALGNTEMRKSWKPTVLPGASVPLQPLSPKAQRWKSGSHGDISRAAEVNDATRLRNRIGSDERIPHHDYVLSKGPGGGPLLRRVSLEKIDDSKVIMETEIKINKESVTMRILEAETSNSNSISEESDEDNVNKRFGVVRVLTDSELEDSVTVKSIGGSQTTMQQDLLYSSDTEYVRRTPRRVRFGGEIVKMRTPDSDTFDQSDQDALSLSQSSNQSTQLLSSSTISDRTFSTVAPPQRSSLKSASSSSERSSSTSHAMMRRQYSQSADTERSSPPSTMAMSSEFNSSITTKPRPSSAKSTMETSGISEFNSGSDPEDNEFPSMVRSNVADEEESTSSRPKSSLSRPKSAKTPPSEPIEQPRPTSAKPDPVSAKADPVTAKVDNNSAQQQLPETPDTQSRPEPKPVAMQASSDASSILADKIEEVKQAIQGIESKINNVVLQKADSVDVVQNHAAQEPTPKKLESNLSLEVLMKTNSNENAENLQQDPSQAEQNNKDYTKELNIEIPKEEKLQNAPPPSPKSSNKSPVSTVPTKPVPKIVRSGIPRLNTMPSPKTMRKVHESNSNAQKSPNVGGSEAKGQLTPQPTNVRGRTLLRSRSATSASLKRSVYISPSSLSPKPHSGIEIMHNLLRSPSPSPHRNRRKSSTASEKGLDISNDKNNNNQLISSVGEGVDGRTDKCISVNEDDIFDVFGKTIATQTSGDETMEIPFVPFTRAPSRLLLAQIDVNGNELNGNTASPLEAKARERGQSPIFSRPVSPKLSENQQIVNSWEDLGIVNRVTLFHLKSPDWRLRSQGFCSIEEALKSSDNLAKVQPYLESLLRTLLSSERNLDVIEDKVRMLVNLVSRLPLENLEDRVGQIMTGLCRQGGPGSNNVAKALMQRLPTAAIVQRLLSDDFLHAKSSKFRENALQTVLFALMTFPSTYFDIKTLISRATEAAMDRKKRVRHAALDVLAVLGQISSPKLVLDVVCTAVGTRPEGNHLITAVKARLARKQLPFIGPDGSVEYAIKVPSNRSSNVIMFGADVDWIEAGSGSASPTFNRPGRHKYPSFQVENNSFEEMRQKPSFTVFDEIKQPIETSKISTNSGWTSKIPVSYSDTMNQALGPNAARPLYGNGQSSRSYPELPDSKLATPFAAAKPATILNRKLEGNLSGIPQIANGKISRNSISSLRFPEMDPKTNGKIMLAKNNNPYEMRTPRMRGKLYSRNSDGFMSDTIASANKQVNNDIRPATDPVVESEGFRQSRFGMRFYNPNQMGNHNKQQMTTHVQKQDVDQRPNLSPSKSYNNHSTGSNGGLTNRSNSASHGELHNYYGDTTVGTGSGTAPSTPHRTRFLGERRQSIPVINQESYIIHRDDNYDSEQDERSSNDSTSTRIISNSILNFRDRDRDRVTIAGDDAYPAAMPGGSRPASIPSVSRPQSVSSHKSIGSGVLKHPEGRLSRTSNTSYSNASVKNSIGDNVSLKTHRSFVGNAQEDERTDREWYGERASTPIHSEMDGISSNQVQYESDYDEDDDENDQNYERNLKSSATPKRYPTPSPHPLQGSYSTEELHNMDGRQEDENEMNDEQEMHISRPRSRVQSASLGNLQHLEREEMVEEARISVSPKKILKKPFLVRRSSKVAPAKEAATGVKGKNKLNEVIFQKTLRRFERPKDALNNCLTHLESPNWEQNISGLQFFVRLIRHHPEVIDTQIHLLSVALAKQVRNLRSQVARAACQASAEFFSTHRRCLEGEAEDIATHLLHRTADTNKFLRADATQALESMCDNVSIPKVVHIISFKGATHQNAVVRTTASKLLNKIVHQLGSEKVFALPKETRDKLILTGAHLLLEGSLETRNYTKSLFKQLSDHSNYSKVLLEVIPPRTYRNIEKTLNSIRQMS
ncbi:uncharacterized protein LOC125762812 [Anopheles funestus]|uniref:uncharacterized protein LOC125762812 n=1 Tax=Anopheles funestus TaxID=62324 RepID=UPI0020C5D176|nr:uncharacterized protein LOC125762812 [Anopheles funestus]